MKNSILLIIGIIAVAAVMVPISYNALTDHYMYTVPIKNSEIAPNYTHVDSFPFEGIGDTHADIMYDVALIDAQTVKVAFRNHGKLPSWPINDFEDFERELSVGDSFATHCEEDAEDSITHFSIFQFNGTRQTEREIFVDFIHGDASSKVSTPCNYPQLVDYSRNIFDLG